MSGHVEDRWHRRDKDGKLVRTSRYGTGRRWRARWTDPAGAERAKSFDTKKAADSYLTQVSADILRGTYTDPAASKIALRTYAQQWLANLTSDDNTRDNVRRRVELYILPALGDKRLDQLANTPSLIQQWLRGLKVAPSTARATLSILSSIFAAAMDDGRVAKNPCKARSVKPPALDQRKVQPLGGAQLDALRAALPEWFRALVDAGRRAGLRQGECFGLAADDIDRERRLIHVRRQVKLVNGRLTFALPKRGKPRDVPLSDGASKVFAAHVLAFPARAVTLPWHEPGTRRHGKPVTVALMFSTPRAHSAVAAHAFNQDVWKPALRKAGIPATRENGMHVLRHTYASVLLTNGVDIRRVAACLGHEDPAFTLRVYQHLMEGGEDRVRRALDDADRPSLIVQRATDM